MRRSGPCPTNIYKKIDVRWYWSPGTVIYFEKSAISPNLMVNNRAGLKSLGYWSFLSEFISKINRPPIFTIMIHLSYIKAWFILPAQHHHCHKISSLSNLHKLYDHCGPLKKLKHFLTFLRSAMVFKSLASPALDCITDQAFLQASIWKQTNILFLFIFMLILKFCQGL